MSLEESRKKIDEIDDRLTKLFAERMEIVSEIGKYAFRYCFSLAKIELSDDIRIIPEGLFDSCEHLVRVDLPKAMTRIDTLAFSGCTSLGTISMHTSLSSIGISAFALCESLSRIELYGSTEELALVSVSDGNEAFLKAEVKEVGK